MDTKTLVAAIDFSRQRLLGLLSAIEKSGQDTNKVLAWRPGPGRAHIGWQAAHLAATLDRYLNAVIQKNAPNDAWLVENFGGGSTPSDTLVPDLSTTRDKLATTLDAFKAFIESRTQQQLDEKMVGRDGNSRSLAEAVILLTWHEAHHQGQIHLTWNLYRASHGLL